MFFGRHGILLDLEPEREDGWESVCELQDADCADQARDVAELRNGGADDPGYHPVCGNESYPEEFSSCGGERWCVE